jgi:hypothetical protein
MFDDADARLFVAENGAQTRIGDIIVTRFYVPAVQIAAPENDP